MTREDLVGVNQNIVTSIIHNVTSTSPNAIFIIVTNTLDTMVYLAYKKAGLPRHRVMGQAGVLDSARMATFIAMELDVSVQNVQASVMGGHGDEMVPLVRYSAVAGIPITQLMTPSAWRPSWSARAKEAARSSACSRPARLIMRRARRPGRWSKQF